MTRPDEREQELIRARESLAQRTAELADALALLRATLEIASDAILVTDSAGKVTEVNGKFAELFGLPSDVLARGDHRALLEVTSRELADPDSYRARVEAIYEEAPPETFDVLELSDGRVIERSSKLHLVDQHADGRVWCFRDVTDQRHAERALWTKSELLRVTLASIDDAVISTDAGGRVTFLNQRAEMMTGWPLGEALEQPLPEVYRTLDRHTRQPVEDPSQRALRVGATAASENHKILVARQGTERIIDDSVAPIQHGDEAALGVVVVFRDVTDRVNTQKAQAQLAAIVSSSQDAIVSKTLDGIITFWNAEAERLFGYSAAEAVGNPVTLIIPPERIDEEMEIMRRLRRGERVDHFESVRLTKDGRRVDVSLTISPILDAFGTIIGASKVARDITDRKRAEALLREADRRKDEFLAVLAHELRNPLAPLQNGLHVLRMAGSDASAGIQAQEMMERQLNHLVRLVDDLLDMSRISQGKLELRRARVSLVEVLTNAVEIARPAIEAAGHHLTTALPPEPIYLLADSVRLSQVFGNLLTNSAKYTERGGSIWLAAQRHGGEVAVSVRDTGIGIPADALETIFDMFSQVELGMQHASGGLGIGLALVQGLVHLHGGVVVAESAGVGKGSTFTVRLPVLAGELARAATRLPQRAGGADETKRRMLVVDDNRDSAHSMSTLLKLLGNEVYLAYDGVEACQAAERFLPEVVLMDVGMPRMNGYEATQRIREQPFGADMVVIALTGWGQESDKAKALAAGCDAHLVKPVNVWQLDALVSKLLRERRLPRR